MENLGIDYKLLIAQIVNFGLLFFLFNRFMAQPFLEYLRKEKKKDMERDTLLNEVQTKHDRMLEEEEQWRKKIKQEQEKILAETKKTAEKVKGELMEDAKAEADALLAKAREQIEHDRENFHKEVRTYIADVSILVIEKALKQYLTADVQKKLTEHILSNLKKGDKLYEN